MIYEVHTLRKPDKGNKTTITVNYNHKHHFMSAAFEGPLTRETVKDYVEDITNVVKALREPHNKRILSNVSNASIELSILDLHLISKETMVNASFDKNWKRAILVKQVDFKKMSFYETTSINQGINLKVFTDKDLANEWLKLRQQ